MPISKRFHFLGIPERAYFKCSSTTSWDPNPHPQKPVVLPTTPSGEELGDISVRLIGCEKTTIFPRTQTEPFIAQPQSARAGDKKKEKENAGEHIRLPVVKKRKRRAKKKGKEKTQMETNT